jgi:hypothetical protein
MMEEEEEEEKEQKEDEQGQEEDLKWNLQLNTYGLFSTKNV